MANNRLEELFGRWYNNQSTSAENEELAGILAAADLDRTLTPLMKKAWEQLKPESFYTEEQIDAMVASILKNSPVETENQPVIIQHQPAAHRVHFLRTSWFRYAAAVVLLVGGVVVLRLAQEDRNRTQGDVALRQAQSDVQPGGNKAVLTVGGKKIDLSSNKTGIAVGSTVTYMDGSEVLNLVQHDGSGGVQNDPSTSSGQAQDDGALRQMELKTPRGGQYEALLPDGSKVWLNAASTIKFPSKFTGTTREIEVTGEVYLEIAKNTKQPFVVKTNKTTVQVLGTSFNVNAYEDEETERTTLIEGSVRVFSGNEPFVRARYGRGQISEPARTRTTLRNSEGVILEPGQQAQVTNNSTLTTRAVDLEETIAWKNGIFNFSNLSLKEGMKQLGRWYDLEIVYKPDVPDVRFYGKLSKSLSLSEVLQALEITGIHFSIEDNRKLIVSP